MRLTTIMNAPHKWFAVLPQSKIVYGEIELDLSKFPSISGVYNSISEQLKTHNPSVLLEHKNSHMSYGFVERVRLLSLQDATALGYDQTSAHMIYLGVRELLPGDLKRAQYASVGLYQDVTDEHGKSWPWWLGELSITGDPHIRHEQTPSFKIKFTNNSKKFFFSATDIDMDAPTAAPSPEAPPADAALIAQLQTELEAMTAERDALLLEVTSLKEVSLEAEAEEEVEELELSADLKPLYKALYRQNPNAFKLAAAGIKEERVRVGQNFSQPSPIIFSNRKSKRGTKGPLSPGAAFAKASAFRARKIAEGQKGFTFKAAMTAVTGGQ